MATQATAQAKLLLLEQVFQIRKPEHVQALQKFASDLLRQEGTNYPTLDFGLEDPLGIGLAEFEAGNTVGHPEFMEAVRAAIQEGLQAKG